MNGNMGVAQANSMHQQQWSANATQAGRDDCRAVDTGALARRIEQLERRVDTLESGLSRREPISGDALRNRKNGKIEVVVTKKLADDPRDMAILVDVGLANVLLQDGWRLANG